MLEFRFRFNGEVDVTVNATEDNGEVYEQALDMAIEKARKELDDYWVQDCEVVT